MKWFRFYNEAAGDFKVQLLEPPQFKDWVNLLCMASANEPRGYLSPIKQIAYVFRTSVADAQARVDMLISEGLFDVMEDGRIRPHNWDARQPECDDAAGRMRAKRAEEKARKLAGKKAGTRGKKKPVPAPEKNDSETAFGTCSEHGTNMFAIEERRLEEKRDTAPPNPPTGGGAHVAIEPEDAEPFHADSETLPAEPEPRVKNDPAEVARTLARVEELFPMAGMASQARQACRDFPAGWVSEAAEIAHGKGKAYWSFIGGIIRRFDEQGGSDLDKKPTRNGTPQGTAASIAEASRKARQAQRDKEASDAR